MAEPSKEITEEGSTGKVIYRKHPLAIRWFHWINFPVLFIMIWSGLMIYWANDVLTVPVPSFLIHGKEFHGSKLATEPFTLFPDSWWSPKAPKWAPDFLATVGQDDDGKAIRTMYKLDGRLAEAMAWHFVLVWFFGLNGILYVTFLVVSGEWRQLIPKPKAFVEAIHVVLYDLHLSRKELPVRKYNAAQQIAYSGVIVMGAIMLITGVSIYKPSEQSWLTHLIGGYTVARFIHFWTTIAFLGFFLVHVGQVIKTGWNNFRGMITGCELVTPSEKRELVGSYE